MYELIKSKLESHPDFRERRFRGKYLAVLALRETGLEDRHRENRIIDLSEMANFAIKYASLEREWRKVTSEHKNLQGTDYNDKIALEQEKMTALEYQPMHEINKKELSNL